MVGLEFDDDDGGPELVDRITYLEIDRSGKKRRQRFQPTDPRSGAPDGGMRINHVPLFVGEQEMPRLRVEHVAQACDNIVRGTETYTSLVYLSRARLEDIGTLFAASQSAEIRVRWERLWVLSPYFSKLSRLPEGQAQVLECMQEDLAAVHLLSKFAEQNNAAVVRLFKRLHTPLLAMLLARLAEYHLDPRRVSLLAGIIATVETDGAVLEKALAESVDRELVGKLLPLLVVRYRDPASKKLSSEVLRDRLEMWSRG